ncbi:hypothetical protein D3C79_1017060 [compost metagenome]
MVTELLTCCGNVEPCVFIEDVNRACADGNVRGRIQSAHALGNRGVALLLAGGDVEHALSQLPIHDGCCQQAGRCYVRNMHVLQAVIATSGFIEWLFVDGCT